jgi:predicted DNA-binding transcriptional regulator AlpA
MSASNSTQKYLRGPELRQRWGGMSNSTFYDRMKRGVIPKPFYPFGAETPYWLVSEIEAHESKAQIKAGA